MVNAISVLDRGPRSEERSISFDPIGYDPSEWEELFTDIDAALELEDLPSLHGDRWQPLEFGFGFTGPTDEVFRVKSVLEQFAMQVYLDESGPVRLAPISISEHRDEGDETGKV